MAVEDRSLISFSRLVQLHDEALKVDISVLFVCKSGIGVTTKEAVPILPLFLPEGDGWPCYAAFTFSARPGKTAGRKVQYPSREAPFLVRPAPYC
jgi:hypothetical protein